MINYDKDEVKQELTQDNIFELFQEWGGDPEVTDNAIVSTTICHNLPGQGSRKLYYYFNTELCKCFTGCENDVFDIFELCIKVMSLQHDLDWDLNDAVRYIANRFGIVGTVSAFNQEDELEDWSIFRSYEQIHETANRKKRYNFKQYNSDILSRFNYNINILPWMREGISKGTMRKGQVGFYPGEDLITIPHFDLDGNFIGLRGRTLCAADAEKYGKYRPIKVNDILYSHPLGMNLYGLNWAKDNISKVKCAIVAEAEKSVLKSIEYLGDENNITVACCGSNLSTYQVSLLLALGVKEICVAFDRQFQEINDDEFKKLTRTLIKINKKYSKYCLISFIFDKHMILNYKDSPFDKDKETFLKLFNERIIL